MSFPYKSPIWVSDEWMLEQQIRAELEARLWRRMREQMHAPAHVANDAAPPDEPLQDHGPNAREASSPFPKRSGVQRALYGLRRALLKVFFVLAGGAVAALAASLGEGGRFETWLAGAAGVMVSLLLLLMAARRPLMQRLAEAGTWGLMLVLVLGAAWAAQNVV